MKSVFHSIIMDEQWARKTYLGSGLEKYILLFFILQRTVDTDMCSGSLVRLARRKLDCFYSGHHLLLSLCIPIETNRVLQQIPPILSSDQNTKSGFN